MWIHNGISGIGHVNNEIGKILHTGFD